MADHSLKKLLMSSLLAMVLCVLWIPSVTAQNNPADLKEDMQRVNQRSAPKAFALSVLFPGWGHKYAQGSWRGRATVFAGAEVGLWLGLISSKWQRNQSIESYQTLATTRAHASIEGKDRAFYLNLASYHSSDEYLEFQLRNRAWQRIDYVDDPANYWNWESEEDFQKFRDLREDAESLGRRRSIFIALLVANRLVAGLSSIQATNKANADFNLSFAPPPPQSQLPIINLTARF